MALVEINNLKKSYARNRGINNVSFDVNEGDIFGFIGPNGAGKSTTIRIMMGLLMADSGTAKIFGMDAAKDSHIIKQDVGYIPSDSVFYNDFVVGDILKYSAELRGCGTDRVKELVKIFDLDTKKRIKQLSFGNRKKVSIALALMHRPKLLIMDEPTSGLDPLMQNVFFNTIEQERTNGSTVILSTHALGDVQKVCNRAAIIKDGDIIADHSIDVLKQNMVKTVKLTFIDEPVLLQADGITNPTINGKELSFDYSGDTKQLLNLAVKLDLSGVLIEEADIEKVFMHYYDGSM